MGDFECIGTRNEYSYFETLSIVCIFRNKRNSICNHILLDICVCCAWTFNRMAYSLICNTYMVLAYVIMCSIDIYVYGVDIFLQIALFYFMFMPINKALSLDAFRKSVNKNPSWTVTLSMRVFQIHLCLIYLSSGYEKMLSPEIGRAHV